MREMNIPEDWKVIDMAWGFSWTSTSNPNQEVNASVDAFTDTLDRTAFGVKDSSLGAPGRGTTKFLGCRFTDELEGLGNSYEYRGHGQSQRGTGYSRAPNACVGNGATLAEVSVDGYFSGNLLVGHSPADATQYFAWRLMRVNRSSPTAVTFTGKIVMDQTDASDEALQNTFTNTVYPDPVTVTTSAPQAWTDIRSMYFRLPFTGLRARIHNYGYRLVS